MSDAADRRIGPETNAKSQRGEERKGSEIVMLSRTETRVSVGSFNRL